MNTQAITFNRQVFLLNIFAFFTRCKQGPGRYFMCRPRRQELICVFLLRNILQILRLGDYIHFRLTSVTQTLVRLLSLYVTIWGYPVN